MTEKAKLKGLRPLSFNPLTNSPLMALSPVTGAGNRVYRAEEATAPAEGQTLLLVNPAATEATATSPNRVSSPQLVPVILPLDLSATLSMDLGTALSMDLSTTLSTDTPAAERQSAGLGGGYCRPAPGAACGPAPCSNHQSP